jgi:hypothetical protein
VPAYAKRGHSNLGIKGKDDVELGELPASTGRAPGGYIDAAYVKTMTRCKPLKQQLSARSISLKFFNG